ncbi:hypothetical protein D3C77_669770 [compost metagenome]
MQGQRSKHHLVFEVETQEAGLGLQVRCAVIGDKGNVRHLVRIIAESQVAGSSPAECFALPVESVHQVARCTTTEPALPTVDPALNAIHMPLLP